MREMIKIVLLSACTVCALGQGRTARAGANQVPGQNPPLPPPSPSTPAPTVPPPVPTDNPPTNLPSDPTGTAPTPDRPIGDPTTNNPGTPAAPIPNDAPTQPPPPGPAPTPVIAPVTTTQIEPEADPGVYSYSWYEPSLRSGIGVSTILGGGVVGFTDRTMRDTTSDIGGLWDLRVTIGSHLPLALEVSYLGSATNINGLPTGNKGTLIGTTVEGALRYNVLPHFVTTPYVFAGAGWQRYDVTQTSVSLSDNGMNAHDNLLEFPIGVGMAYRAGGFVADVRGTFRVATDQNLVLTNPTTVAPTSSDFADMHTWEASAALGMEF